MIKIFGKKFIENNQFNCKMLIDNSPNRTDISEYLNVNSNMKKNGCVYITLIEINPIKDMSYIFGKYYHNEGEVQIQKLKDISNWDTKNIVNMSKFFCECNELISVPNLSSLDTQNVKNMSFFFFGCEKLEKIEEFEKRKINNVENMSNMFAYCKK